MARPTPTLFDNKNGTPDQLDVKTLEGWLWKAACSIRGPVDAPKFKDYIIPLIFVKRLSDVFEDEVKRVAEKFGDVETAKELIDKDHSLVRFYIPDKALWPQIRKLTSKVGEKVTEAMRAIAKENPGLQGVIDIVDFNATVSGQRIIDDGKLSSLIEIISKQRLRLANCEPDILGRAYDYLLRKFAEGQGHSGGIHFWCRRCYNLTYTSCNESRKYDRLFALVAKNLGTTLHEVKRVMRTGR